MYTSEWPAVRIQPFINNKQTKCTRPKINSHSLLYSTRCNDNRVRCWMCDAVHCIDGLQRQQIISGNTLFGDVDKPCSLLMNYGFWPNQTKPHDYIDIHTHSTHFELTTISVHQQNLQNDQWALFLSHFYRQTHLPLS